MGSRRFSRRIERGFFFFFFFFLSSLLIFWSWSPSVVDCTTYGLGYGVLGIYILAVCCVGWAEAGILRFMFRNQGSWHHAGIFSLPGETSFSNHRMHEHELRHFLDDIHFGFFSTFPLWLACFLTLPEARVSFFFSFPFFYGPVLLMHLQSV